MAWCLTTLSHYLKQCWVESFPLEGSVIWKAFPWHGFIIMFTHRQPKQLEPPQVTAATLEAVHLAVREITGKQNKQPCRYAIIPQPVRYQPSSGTLRHAYRESQAPLPLWRTVCFMIVTNTPLWGIVETYKSSYWVTTENPMPKHWNEDIAVVTKFSW